MSKRNEIPIEELLSNPALNDQQRLFISYYTGECCFDAEAAAAEIGLPRSKGRVLLENRVVKAIVSRIVSDKIMTPDEVAATLSNYAKGNLGHFLNDNGEVDLTSRKAKQYISTVKVYERKLIPQKDGDPIIHEKVQLHDNQVALQTLARIHGMFIDRTEQTMKVEVSAIDAVLRNLTPEQRGRITQELNVKLLDGSTEESNSEVYTDTPFSS